MHGPVKTKLSSKNLTLGNMGNGIVLMGGIGGLALLIVAYFLSLSGGGFRSFINVYLVNFLFFLSISLGALFFVIVQHLTRAGWSVAVRRIAEILAGTLPFLAILFVPIFLAVYTPDLFGSGKGVLYLWNSEAWWTAHFTETQTKQTYFMNPDHFAIRAVVYFVVWIALSVFFLRTSRVQDENGNPDLTSRMQWWSAPGVLLFAFSVVFVSFDWSMSLAPLWFSTIYPVYFFAGGMMGALCTMILILILLQRNGIATEDVTTEHYHDLAKLTFGFVFFWSYIAFSQFLLIWYANIPEETVWFSIRMDKAWQIPSLILILGHFALPFLLFMPRTLRRSKSFLFYGTIFLLAMHWYDQFWIVMPQAGKTFSDLLAVQDVGASEGTVFGHTYGPIEACCFVGMLLLYSAAFCWVASDRPLVPTKDPRLAESLNFEVH